MHVKFEIQFLFLKLIPNHPASINLTNCIKDDFSLICYTQRDIV